MKRLAKLFMMMLVLTVGTGLTGCNELLPDLFDNPVTPTPEPTPTPTPTPEAEPTPEPEPQHSVQELLKNAQQGGAQVTVTYILNGVSHTVTFKKEDNKYVLLTSNGTRDEGGDIKPYLTLMNADDDTDWNDDDLNLDDGDDVDDGDEFEDGLGDGNIDWDPDEPDEPETPSDDDDEDEGEEGDDDTYVYEEGDGTVFDEYDGFDEGDDEGDTPSATRAFGVSCPVKAWTRADNTVDRNLLFGVRVMDTGVDLLQVEFDTATGLYTQAYAEAADADGNSASFVDLTVNSTQVSVTPDNPTAGTRATTKKNIKVTSIKLNKNRVDVKNTNTLQATVKPSNVADNSIKWTSTNSAVATVKKKGTAIIKKNTKIFKCTVTAVKKGKTTVKCQSINKKSANCTVSVSSASIMSVELNKKNIKLKLIKNGFIVLKATVLPDEVSQAVTWKSSQSKVATVDKNGKVKILKNGKAVITATAADGKHHAKCNITVLNEKGVKVKGVSLNETELKLTEGEDFTLTATVEPINATYKDVTWKSSNKKVATVDEDGNVTAVKAGEATITVTTVEEGMTAKCKVTVKAPESTVIDVTGVTIKDGSDNNLNGQTLTLTAGDETTLTAEVAPEKATNKTVTWSVSGDAITFNEEIGKVTAVKAGTATITATADGKSATVTITVNAPTNTVNQPGGYENSGDPTSK